MSKAKQCPTIAKTGPKTPARLLALGDERAEDVKAKEMHVGLILKGRPRQRLWKGVACMKPTMETYKVGVVGHRALGPIERQSFIHFWCHRILAILKKKHANMIAVSAIADGADTIFAQSAISLGIELESIIPFGLFSSDFQDEVAYERYRCLRSTSRDETQANFSERSNQAYRKSMEWVMFKSNIVVAVWDGREEGTIGGTWEAISLGIKMRKPIIHIDNVKETLNLYFNNGCDYALEKNITSDRLVRMV